ncbi:MAG: hypothetical protein K6B75_05160, partial [Lachnospiraceae bacterium]|nr:hypothetical protein [Lachnospiraceae bacterium]
NNYNGTTKNMYELWASAKSGGIDALVLEERLLGQILFAESYVEDSFSVFKNYYKRGSNRKLIKAYLSYYSYKYFVKDRMTPREFFEILKTDPFVESNNICVLALLKHYSTKIELTDLEKSFCEYYIQKFEQKKMVFSFYRNFTGKLSIPLSMSDKYYVEYRANPDNKVTLHYCLNDEGIFTHELMSDNGYGVFEKELILFYGDTLQYYISEESSNGLDITESELVHFEDADKGIAGTKYSKINEILMTEDMKDEKTLLSLLEQYFKEEFVIKRHFSPV